MLCWRLGGGRLSQTDSKVSVENVVVATLRELLGRRGADGALVVPAANLLTDLALDSLELAEMSATLEDEFGRDPFSEGTLPETVSDLIAYYA